MDDCPGTEAQVATRFSAIPELEYLARDAVILARLAQIILSDVDLELSGRFQSTHYPPVLRHDYPAAAGSR